MVDAALAGVLCCVTTVLHHARRRGGLLPYKSGARESIVGDKND
ncbi:hypothetical protein BURKHO8Y_180068 [Burkholderia sp. 8Y]|nr:hypothetical protein BURKHO8Y_180068 [Burkholderia sp. 8Y]